MRTNVTYASGLCINHPLQPTREAPKKETPKEKNLFPIKGQKSEPEEAAEFLTYKRGR